MTEGANAARILPLLRGWFWWLCVCAGTFVWACLAYPEFALDLHKRWTTPDDLDLGYVVLVIFACANFGCWTGSTHAAPRGTTIAAVVLLGLNQVATLVSYLVNAESILQVTILANVPLLAWLFWGRTAFLNAASASSILLFSLPIWYVISPLLQAATVFVVSKVVTWMGITVHITSTQFHVATGVIEVAGGCSGHKYFIAGMTIALCFLHFARLEWVARFKLILYMVGLSLLTNWIRVAFLIWYGSEHGAHTELMDDHDMLGWFIFLFAIVAWSQLARQSHPKEADHSVALSPDSPRIPSRASIAFAVVLICLPKTVDWVHGEVEPDASQQLKELVAGHGASATMSNWSPAFSGYKTFDQLHFDEYSPPVSIGRLEYWGNLASEEMITSENQILNEAERVNSQVRRTDFESYSCLEWERNLARRTIVYWFESNGTVTADRLKIRLAIAWSRLTNGLAQSELWYVTSTTPRASCQLISPARELIVPSIIN